MKETQRKLLVSARKACGRNGFSATSMNDLTAAAGLTRGALYHSFGDKKRLFAAVSIRSTPKMAERARAVGTDAGTLWDGLLAEGSAYMKMALDPEVQRIVLLDGSAVLGNSARWLSQNRCLDAMLATGLLADRAPREDHKTKDW
ncbi:TetR/AcrR family transcriptional regulator [Paracoccus sp. (in: a-proteobacteria)]|uniref:TetR/AcrR family transcriptional regulator n=1 Tax=Paracoccus sp. TaxID=267 RepID=UPI00396C468E